MGTTIRPALLEVDLQKDFFPGGSLGIEGAFDIVAPINMLQGWFLMKRCPIIRSRDWHDEDHSSFVEQGGPWPIHTVKHDLGSQFVGDLKTVPAIVLNKGTGREEAYSVVTNEYGQIHEGNFTVLQGLMVNRFFLVGLAAEYCVYETAKDLLHHFGSSEVIIVEDCIRAVSHDDAVKKMRHLADLGAQFTTSDVILSDHLVAVAAEPPFKHRPLIFK